ncbi:MAG: hypothetical protein KGY99_07150 [Phycisphaerae bacterium]|nr:hypothetical protein [Phycisphaerae bacterium]
MAHTHDTHGTCPGQCGHCVGTSPGDRVALRGARLALVSAGAFLLPLILGIVGASLISGSPAAKFAGAAGGLAAGLILAAVVSRRAARRGRSEA